MAVRSFNIQFYNQTGFPLTNTGAGLSHGEWSSNLSPPPSVAASGPSATPTFQSESDGIMTGTQGDAIYQVVDNSGTTSSIYIGWDNPYMGSTSFKALISTVPIDSNGNPISSGGGSSFNATPSVSDYELSAGFVGGGDGTDPGWNAGALVPFVEPLGIFLDAGNIPHAILGVVVSVKTTNLALWAKRRGYNLSKGVRVLNPPGGSLRALMQLPPVRAKPK